MSATLEELKKLLSEGYIVTLAPFCDEIVVNIILQGRPCVAGYRSLVSDDVTATNRQETLEAAIEAVYIQVPER